MLAVSAAPPGTPADYAYEFKWDGYRAVCLWDGRRVRFQSRNLNDLTDAYPGLSVMKGGLKRLGPLVLDGEIVALDRSGRPDFSLLQNARRGARPQIVYMIFDLIYAGGENLSRLPYAERRRRLEALSLRGACWDTPPSRAGQPVEMVEVARRHGYEGVIAKRLDSPYRFGDRGGEWIKMKFSRRQEFVVAGWLPGEGANRGSMGSLLLGYFRHGALRYAGKVGTGFSVADRAALMRFLAKTASEASPFSEPVPFRQARFAAPRLVCEVEFTEWTPDGKVRHPSFKGLRADRKPLDVTREPSPVPV